MNLSEVAGSGPIVLLEEEPLSPPIATSDGVVIEDEVDAEIDRTVPQTFTVNSPETAAWLVRRIVAARKYAEKVKLWAELELRRAAREEQRLSFLYGAQLRDWAEAEVRKLRGRRQSIVLPGGVVGFRSVPIRLAVKDETLAMRWARRSCPAAVVVSERLVKTPLNEHFAKTGEVPEGVEVIPPHVDFYVR